MRPHSRTPLLTVAVAVVLLCASVRALAEGGAGASKPADVLTGWVDRLQKNLKTRAATREAETPLHQAARRGHLEKVRRHLTKGTDPNAKDKKRQTPLHHAVDRGHGGVARLLLAGGADVEARDALGQTPLYRAVERGHGETVALLLEAGADVETRTDKKVSPLYAAAYRGHVDLIERLLDAGAKVNARIACRRTALFGAAEQGQSKSADVLLAHGADANAKSVHKLPQRPIHVAVLNGHVETAKRLLAHGADVNARAAYDMTPLYIATVAGKDKMTAALRAHGADGSIGNVSGQTPAQGAALMRHRKTKRLVPASERAKLFDARAIVIVLYLGKHPWGRRLKGPRVAFAIGDGSLVATAAHCVDDFAEDPERAMLVRPLLISPYYGDVFEAEIVATDEKADVAILRPSWGAHPGLPLATTRELSKARRIMIAGYPATRKEDGVRRVSRNAFVEAFDILKLDPKGGEKGVTVGGARYAGPGWSGSAMILSRSGKAAGVFGNRAYCRYGDVTLLYNLMGCGVGSIRSLLAETGLPADSVPEVAARQQPPDAHRAFDVVVDHLEAFMNRETDRKLSTAEEFVRRRPRSVRARLLLAGAAYGKHMADRSDLKAKARAEASYQEALKLDPNHAEAHATYGEFLMTMKRRKEARAELERALELEPDQPFAQVSLLGVLVKLDPARAVALGRRLVGKSPEKADYWTRFASALSEAGKHEEAVEAARTAAKLRPKGLYDAWLARALAKAGRLDEAESIYVKRRDANPRSSARWYAYARFLIERRPVRAAEARKALEKTESLNRPPIVPPEDLEKLREKLRVAPQSRAVPGPVPRRTRRG